MNGFGDYKVFEISMMKESILFLTDLLCFSRVVCCKSQKGLNKVLKKTDELIEKSFDIFEIMRMINSKQPKE
jgi:hypothetical protein